jgi:hypothetical protein
LCTCSQRFKLFGFPIFWLYVYLVKVKKETLRVHEIRFLHFLLLIVRKQTKNVRKERRCNH